MRPGRLRRRELSGDETRHVVRSVYLLPNLFTTGNLVSGLAAMHLAVRGLQSATPGEPVVLYPYFTAAAIALLVAIFCDGMDGLVAVMTRTTSKFGMQYDSLADMVSFGAAPSVIVFALFFPVVEKPEFAVMAIFTVCTALRLARYNVQAVSVEKGEFLGLPSPAPAGTLASLLLFLHWASINIDPQSYVVRTLFLLGMLLLAFLMVSNVRYINPKRPAFARARRHFYHLVALLFITALALQLREGVFLPLFLAYIFYGIFRHFYRVARPKPSVPTPED